MNRNCLAESPQTACSGRSPEYGGMITSLHSFSQNEEMYGEGEGVYYWYRVVSGTVRACNLLADGRRYIAEFFFSDDFFGFGTEERYLTSAESVS